MKKDQNSPAEPPLANTTAINPLNNYSHPFILPPGIKFDDMYMDLSSVCRELGVSKRKVQNMKRDGKLSFTMLEGSVYFLRQEIAGMLRERLVIAEKSYSKKMGWFVAKASRASVYISHSMLLKWLLLQSTDCFNL